jgi:hypothetical protein
LLIPLACGLLLFLSVNNKAQSASALFEIVHTVCAGDCEHDMTRVFADGRYISEGWGLEETKSKRSRRVFIRIEKQLEKEELIELVEIAEQRDFLEAAPEYVKVVREQPDWFTITYRNKGREKTVQVYNFSRSSELERGKVPIPIVKLIEWADPYYLNWPAK